MMTKHVRAPALAAMLLAASPGLALAQAAGANGAGAVAAQGGNGYGQAAGGWGSGWWGLLGLVGLFGLAGGRSRSRSVAPAVAGTAPDPRAAGGPGARRL